MPGTAKLALATLLFASQGHAGVYRWIDAEGVLHFADRPPALDVGEHLELRQPNLIDAYRPPRMPRPPKRVDAPAVSRLPGRIREADQDAQRALRCREARQARRDLRTTRRRGYALAEEQALEERARSLTRIIRSECP